MDEKKLSELINGQALKVRTDVNKDFEPIEDANVLILPGRIIDKENAGLKPAILT